MPAYLTTIMISALAGLWSGAALGHALLDRADPSNGSVLRLSPTALRLFFNEAIEPRFSTISLIAANGAAVVTGKPTLARDNPSEFDLPITHDLGPGAYQVRWQVVGVDAHASEGALSFEVRP